MVVPHTNAIRHSGQMGRNAAAISTGCPRQIHGAVAMPHDAAILVPTACVPGWDLAGSRRSQVRQVPGGGGLQGLAANEVSKTDNRERSPRDGEVFDWITEVFSAAGGVFRTYPEIPTHVQRVRAERARSPREERCKPLAGVRLCAQRGRNG